VSKHLTVTQTVELLDQLKATLREVAAAEEKLNREHRIKVDTTQRRFQSEMEAHETEVSAQRADAEATFARAEAQIKERYEKRKARIARAHKAAKKTALERANDEEGRQKYTVQKGLLDTERNRAENLRQNDATLAEFQAQLAESEHSFGELEHSARKSFGGYLAFRRMLAGSFPPADTTADEYQLMETLRQSHSRATDELKQFKKIFLPQFFRFLPLWLWALLLGGTIATLYYAPQFLSIDSSRARQGIIGAVLLMVVLAVLYFLGQSKGRLRAKKIAETINAARHLHHACGEKAQARHSHEIERIEAEAANWKTQLNESWGTAVDAATNWRELWPKHVEEKAKRAVARHEKWNREQQDRLRKDYEAQLQENGSAAEKRKTEITEGHKGRMERLQCEFDLQITALESEWNRRIVPIYQAIDQSRKAATDAFADWTNPSLKNWQPPAAFQNAARLGELQVDAPRYAEAAPQGPKFKLPGPSAVSLPLVLTYPQQGSVLFETTKSGNDAAISSLNNIIFRLLAGSPAGKVSFTIIDPVKLGQNFAAVMHLADYEDNLISGRIWTQPNQIEERLAWLNEHMEKVIQMYLRNEYETIADYNVDAGNIAEKYHFVVVADFPVNFSESAVRRLLRIAASGARCGVYTLIHWDHRHPAPPDFLPEELRKSSVCINCSTDPLVLTHPPATKARTVLETPPPQELATEFLHHVGETSRGSNRVEVPFAQIAPAPNDIWSIETTDELRVPIGRAGATKLQYLSIGKGTRQHALIAGKTGSGKSTLFHVMITNLALWASPEQVEFYLVDFKKGVEFKAYAARRLPHARVVAIESDREFGLSVLQKIDDELKRRGELFRKLGVQDVAGYKKAGGNEPMPRSLLLIDEFQEFFVEDDRISQAANVLLDRIVRQGRAFGIHVILGSQTLGGAYTLARTTMGQMVIRIALQCNEADAYLIMDENNPAPRLLSRPGEGIYNDMAGAVEGNSPFQAVWISDEARDERLQQVRSRADRNDGKYPGPIVFEGNAPADVSDNALFKRVLEHAGAKEGQAARVWLGAPNSIKGPTEVVFQKRGGNNLIIVGQREEAVLGMIALGLVALEAQYPAGKARFALFDSTLPGTPERALIEQITSSFSHPLSLGRTGDLAQIINGLAEELKIRTETEKANSEPVYLFIHGLQNFKKFRQEDEFAFGGGDDGPNPAAQLQKLITEGPAHDIHVIVSVDTFNNVNRFLGRKTLGEFEMRVLFQMSTNDSASLCDDPKASTLGLHRALLYNEQEGYLETFRPYALPSAKWFEQARAKGF